MVDEPHSRIIAERRSLKAGPTLIILAAIHGNEPSGQLALQKVAQELSQFDAEDLNGHFIGLLGNRSARSQNKRFVSHDLNRAWTNQNVQRIHALNQANSAQSTDTEDQEQLDLLNEIRTITKSAMGPIYFLDLHTTSAISKPFVLLGDTLRNRNFARTLPITAVLGLEEQIDGTITEWMSEQGYISIGFEAGQHHDARSVDYHEAGIWLALAATGILPSTQIPSYDKYQQLLRTAAIDLPQFVEVHYRHGINKNTSFKMHPDYENFQQIKSHHHLADDQQGPVHSPDAGRILLPLYQRTGDDGFFLCRDVKPIWLKISRLLRHLRAHRIAPLLPGVTRCPDRPGTLIINSKIARWLANEFFHLLGYRKKREENNLLIVSRRRFDYE